MKVKALKKALTLFHLAQIKDFQIISAAEKDQQNWIPLGSIVGAHGIRGALKIHLKNPNSNCLMPDAELGLSLPTGDLVLMAVDVSASSRLFLKGIQNRNEAEALRGTAVFIKRQDFPEISENEIYLADLLGAKAVDIQENLLGIVTGFTDNRAQILVEIEQSNGDKVLLPFVKPILHKIDEVNHCVIFDPPSGFFDE